MKLLPLEPIWHRANEREYKPEEVDEDGVIIQQAEEFEVDEESAQILIEGGHAKPVIDTAEAKLTKKQKKAAEEAAKESAPEEDAGENN